MRMASDCWPRRAVISTQDAVDLALLVFEEADKFVVLLDGFQGLDEDGLAAGAGSVDDALDAALLLGFDGDDEAVAADGDQLVLQGVAFGEAAEIAAQRVLDGAALLFDLAADGGQGGRGVVVEGSVGRKLVGEVAQERGEILDGGAELLDSGPGRFAAGYAATDAAPAAGVRLTHGLRGMGGGFAPLGGAIDEEDDIAEFGGFQGGSSDAGAEDELARIGEAAEIEASAGAEEGTHLGGELLLALDPFGIGGGRKRVHRLLAELALAAAAHNLAEAVKLKHGGAGVKERGGHESHSHYRRERAAGGTVGHGPTESSESRWPLPPRSCKG